MLTEKQLWLDEPYEIESIWYPSFSVKKTLPTKKKPRHHGKLTYSSSNGALLQLYHEDESLNWGDNMIYGGEGNSVLDEKITCLSTSLHSFTNKSTTFRVGSVFKGFHLPDANGKNILELRFSIKHLNQWLEKTGFVINRNTDDCSFTISYKGSLGEWLKLNDLFDFRISSFAFPPHKVGDYGKIETREHIVFQLRGVNGSPQKYSDFIRLLDPILDFFTLASLDCANPFNISVTGDFDYIDGFDGTKVPASAILSLSPIAISNQWFEAQKPYFLFCEEDLEKPLQCYLIDWLKKYELVCTPFSLYKSAIYGEKHIDTKFLLLSQAVETYHRRFRAPCKGEIYLKKRIQELINENKNILERYFKIPEDLGKKIADARNYLTHFDKDNQEITPLHLVFYSTILKALFELSLLREIGFENDKISMLTKNCESFRKLKYNAI